MDLATDFSASICNAALQITTVEHGHACLSFGEKQSGTLHCMKAQNGTSVLLPMVLEVEL